MDGFLSSVWLRFTWYFRLEGPKQYLERNFEKVHSELAAKNLRPMIFYHSSEQLSEIADGSVQLVATSPPYPMIEMWDGLFEQLLHLPNGSFTKRLDAFDLSHEFLEKIWSECYRVLEKGGFLCVNIGDATRTIGSNFKCFMNHSRILEICEKIGFQSLVPILWKKPTNKPNAFLGSGFFPPNAYVTLDCEYVLLLRKGSKRTLRPGDHLRYASQYSKKERDVWFSQIWDFRGASQDQPETAPFPDELPYRLIRMFSCLGETVLDPFLGTGTTVRIARALGRRGIGYEFNKSLKPVVERNVPLAAPNPREVLDRLLRLYEAAELQPTLVSSTRLSNIEDKTLSAYR